MPTAPHTTAYLPSRPPLFSELIDQLSVRTVCLTTEGGTICAAGYARVGETTATLFGAVHPTWRKRGLGRALIAALEDAAQRPMLHVRSEALHPDAERLFAACGYRKDFSEFWLRRDLIAPIPRFEPLLVETWTMRNASRFFETYVAAFSTRPRGTTDADASGWIAEYDSDPDFRPELSYLAMMEGRDAAFVTTFAGSPHPDTGYIGQIGTHPDFRRRGIAQRLLGLVMARFAVKHVPALDIHVGEDNPEAIRVYEGVGFVRQGRRGRYIKTP